MRLAPEVYANNPVKNVKVNNDGGLFCQKQKQQQQQNHQLCSRTSKNFIIFSIPLTKRKPPMSYMALLLSFPFLSSTLRWLAWCYAAQATQKAHSPLPDLMILYQNSTFRSVSCLVLPLRECFLGWISCQIKSLWQRTAENSLASCPPSTLRLDIQK